MFNNYNTLNTWQHWLFLMNSIQLFLLKIRIKQTQMLGITTHRWHQVGVVNSSECHRTSHHLTIHCSHFLSLIASISWFNVQDPVRVNMWFLVPRKEKSQVPKSGDFESHGMSPTPRCTLFENMSVVHKHAMLNRSLLHSFWNGIKFQGKWLIARFFHSPTVD